MLGGAWGRGRDDPIVGPDSRLTGWLVCQPPGMRQAESILRIVRALPGRPRRAPAVRAQARRQGTQPIPLHPSRHVANGERDQVRAGRLTPDRSGIVPRRNPHPGEPGGLNDGFQRDPFREPNPKPLRRIPLAVKKSQSGEGGQFDEAATIEHAFVGCKLSARADGCGMVSQVRGNANRERGKSYASGFRRPVPRVATTRRLNFDV